MNYLIKDTTLTAIGDAVRAKGNTEDKILVSDLATAISNLPTGGGGGGVEVEPIVLSGDCQYGCAGPIAAAYIDNFGDTISTNGITNATYMFYQTSLKEVPFEINFKYSNNNYDRVSLNNMFQYSKNLTKTPKLNQVLLDSNSNLFSYCGNLREISEDFYKNIDFSYAKNQTSSYSCSNSSMFRGCNSLREIPMALIADGNKTIAYSSSYFYQMCEDCFTLNELVNLPLYFTSKWDGNAFAYTFYRCSRLKRLIFENNEDGTPKVMNWKNQTIDLSSNVGYAAYNTQILLYNSGITADKEVKDDATYQALKNDPDWFSIDINYSRYNHDSAVETINSLPDCSATGTNTIKFKGASGALTDGGAINTLTEEEIAVAAAKGWTVTLS